jgi:hypothetical protein
MASPAPVTLELARGSSAKPDYTALYPVGLWINDELGNIWKEAIMPLYVTIPAAFLQGHQPYEDLGLIAGATANIRTENLLNSG